MASENPGLITRWINAGTTKLAALKGFTASQSIAKHSEIHHSRLAIIPESVSNVQQSSERYWPSNSGSVSKTSYVLQKSSSGYI